MKYLLTLIFLMVAVTSCKKDRPQPLIMEKETTSTDFQKDSLVVTKPDKDITVEKAIEIKQKELKEKKDDREHLGPLIADKEFYKETDFYVLDFHYPFLNESMKPTHSNFNQYISQNYLNISEVEAQILEDKELLCDTLRIHQIREKRLVRYKIYQVNEQLISVLFYKENYYSGAMHPAYTFDCLNFELQQGRFMKYEDFFNTGSEAELRNILNETLSERIDLGEVFYDCWEITVDDFFRYKNNFVVDGQSVEFYFEDCVICPAYTGEYSVVIPLEKLVSVLRHYPLNPLKS
ncbi:MAG: RsiV family protein [Flavobacteriaceae bacterium]